MWRIQFLFTFLIFLFFPFNGFSADTLVTAGKHYKAGKFKSILLGSHYRKEWTTSVRVPLFRIDTIKGGLTPVKQGGSRQTTNLRLVDSLDRQYVIRSVDKTPSRALPENLQKSVAAKIMQDQTSAAHPFAPLVLPSLAKAAEILHTNPALYYIPFDTAFGEFTQTFAGTLVFFEERPDEDMSHLASSGNSENVIGTQKLFEKLYKNSSNRIDEILFIRSRLFDMWIGDWGRHEDQWRWAEYETENGNLYKPIPRDRDHAFFKFDGVLPYIGSRKWAFPQFVNFDYKIKNLYGLNKSATSLDRAILISASLDDWIQEAEHLKNKLNDSIIEASVNKLPANIFKIHGNEIIKKLKSRRDMLPEIARKYYLKLFRRVDITASQKDEIITIIRKEPSSAEVFIIKNNNTKDTVFQRTYCLKETKEIRVFGLDGNDQFHVLGKARTGPEIHLIGGEGNDKFLDQSVVKSFRKKNFIYDSPSGTQLIPGENTKEKISNNPLDSVNAFNRSKPDYNFNALTPSAEYNPDDGIFFGLAFVRKTYGFRKYPFASRNRINFNYATKTSALSFRYLAEYRKIIGRWNLTGELRLFGPRFALNYFGFGNNSVQQEDTSITYYRVRATRIFLEPILHKNLSKFVMIGFGYHYEYFNIERTPGRFLTEQSVLDNSNTFKPNNYTGLKAFWRYSTVDSTLSPKKGILAYAESGVYTKLENFETYVNINGNIALYYTLPLPFRITLGTRIGGAYNFGEFEFYRANTLGGNDNLRGYRRTRFYGRSSFYHNNDLRIYLGEANLLIIPATIGILGFFDYGRVWADGEKSNKIHSSYGPGFFIQFYNRAVLSASYSLNNFANIELGYFF